MKIRNNVENNPSNISTKLASLDSVISEKKIEM
jgi:hypothetical protein